jgi:hypothetical protein
MEDKKMEVMLILGLADLIIDGITDYMASRPADAGPVTYSEVVALRELWGPRFKIAHAEVKSHAKYLDPNYTGE